MANNFNDNANKKNLNGSDISYTTYRTNYPNDEAMKENGGVPSGGSDVNLEDNKTTTIDVSTYTEPVEIEPSENYDGMKKATVTLSNIPSGGETLYLWNDYSSCFILPVNTVEQLQDGMKGYGTTDNYGNMFEGILHYREESSRWAFYYDKGEYSYWDLYPEDISISELTLRT